LLTIYDWTTNNMSWVLIAQFLRRWWPFGVIAALALLSVHLNSKVTHWRDQATICANARVADQATYKAAAAQAADNNKATVLATERKWQTVVDQTSKDYNAKLKAANSIVAGYIDGVQHNQAGARAANSGSATAAGLSPSSFSASGSIGTSEAALIPVPSNDLYVCSENTLKASEWQEFWKQVAAAQPN
jgi:hypothetical protein